MCLLFTTRVLPLVAGIDDLLAKHVAHLFIRDPISLFSEKLQQDDAVDTDHFEVTDHWLAVATTDRLFPGWPASPVFSTFPYFLYQTKKNIKNVYFRIF